MIDAMSTRAKMRLRFPAQVWFFLCPSHKSASLFIVKISQLKMYFAQKKNIVAVAQLRTTLASSSLEDGWKMSSSVFPGSILFFSGYPIAHIVLKIPKSLLFKSTKPMRLFSCNFQFLFLESKCLREDNAVFLFSFIFEIVTSILHWPLAHL